MKSFGIITALPLCSGSILYKGRDFTRIYGRAKRLQFMKEVQAIFQDPFDTFNPLKHIDSYPCETALNYPVASSRKQADVVVGEALAAVGLSLQEIKGRYPHDLAMAYYVSDRIGVMLRGEIIEIGGVEQVLQAPLHPYTKLLRDSVPAPDPRERWTEEIKLGAMETKEYAKTGCKFAGRCPSQMPICADTEPPELQVDGRIVKCHLYGRPDRAAS
jgi:peptide/nickel transport system ATP-binding protein